MRLHLQSFDTPMDFRAGSNGKGGTPTGAPRNDPERDVPGIWDLFDSILLDERTINIYRSIMVGRNWEGMR